MDDLSNYKEYLEKENFLFWYERFHKDVGLYAGNEIFIKLREKYRHVITWVDTLLELRDLDCGPAYFGLEHSKFQIPNSKI